MYSSAELDSRVQAIKRRRKNSVLGKVFGDEAGGGGGVAAAAAASGGGGSEGLSRVELSCFSTDGCGAGFSQIELRRALPSETLTAYDLMVQKESLVSAGFDVSG